MRLFLVRHGQTEANRQGVFCGMTDLDLTDTGVVQAQRVAACLAGVAFSDAFSSELRRARRTANIVLGARPRAVVTDRDFNEMNFGDWEMRHHRDLQHEDAEAWANWVADWQQACPTAGESFPLFCQRVERTIPQFTAKNRDGNVLLVAHQGVLGLLVARLLEMPPAGMWHFHFEQGAYSVLDISDGFTALRAFNSRAPWEPEIRE